MSDTQLRLATTQALIYDNDASLSTISAKVDQLIAKDEISPLVRIAHLNANLLLIVQLRSVRSPNVPTESWNSKPTDS